MALKLFPYQGIGEKASNGTELRVGDIVRIELIKEWGFGETYYDLYSIRKDGAYKEYECRDNNEKPIVKGVHYDGSRYAENDKFQKKFIKDFYDTGFSQHGETPLYLRLGVSKIIIIGSIYDGFNLNDYLREAQSK